VNAQDLADQIIAGLRPTLIRTLDGEIAEQIRVEAVRCLTDGLRSAVANTCARNHLLKELTNTERAVLAHAARGDSAQQIGNLLGIAKKTVQFHEANIRRKLGVHTMLTAILIFYGLPVDEDAQRRA
jgi:DNA-binding CsgD family transcriptional regulator